MALTKKDLEDRINKQVGQFMEELNELYADSEVEILLEDGSDPKIVHPKSGKINFSIKE